MFSDHSNRDEFKAHKDASNVKWDAKNLYYSQKLGCEVCLRAVNFSDRACQEGHNMSKLEICHGHIILLAFYNTAFMLRTC